ncbi:MAG: DUF2752 domain-containing protein [Pirellulales bacterium]
MRGRQPAPLHPAAARHRHWLILGLSLAVAAMAFLLEVRPDQRVAIRGLPQWPLPHSCFSRMLAGVSCPGCGLTRSFVHLAHGDWRASVEVHRLGWLLAAAVVSQFPYRLFALARVARRDSSGRWAEWFGIGLVVLLLANWLAGLAGI